jgi:hypothetical protein
MIISVRQISRFLRMLVLVAILSFILFKVLTILQALFEPVDKYREPRGDAVKVDAELADSVPRTAWEEVWRRLSLFYKIGE